MFHSQLILDHAQHTAARVRRLRLAGGASVKSRIERWESRDVTQKLKPPEVGKATQSLLRSRTQRGNPYIRKDEQTGNAKRQQEDIIVQQFKARRRKSTVPSVLSLGFSTSESSEEGEEDRLTAITTPSVSSFCSLEVEVGIWDGQCDIEVIEAPHCPLPAPLITAARVWDELPRIKVPEAPSRPPPPLPDTQTCEKKLKIRIPDAPRRHPPPPPITTFQDWNEELTYKVPKAPRRPPPPPPILSPEIDIRTVWEVLELAKDSADMRAVIDERDDELEAQIYRHETKVAGVLRDVQKTSMQLQTLLAHHILGEGLEEGLLSEPLEKSETARDATVLESHVTVIYRATICRW